METPSARPEQLQSDFLSQDWLPKQIVIGTLQYAD